ncbi:Beta,beta-carotene 15,15'-dioxygenase [Portunus trituberculatus]|uniref:Beta,beta-carotene 15,15'-dioxygenase n=1 Tax=Portunus trituberculatus TaxID=210409 RepID=A0A5B7FCV3_PORTR|nr:Beta,beta-carotene 15,15'-dioxygenase [Portunus trituberculatus]
MTLSKRGVSLSAPHLLTECTSRLEPQRVSGMREQGSSGFCWVLAKAARGGRGNRGEGRGERGEGRVLSQLTQGQAACSFFSLLHYSSTIHSLSFHLSLAVVLLSTAISVLYRLASTYNSGFNSEILLESLDKEAVPRWKEFCDVLTQGCPCRDVVARQCVVVVVVVGERSRGSDPWLNAKTLSTISSSWKACYGYYHSFAMSENYVVFLEQPLLVSTLKLATAQLKSRSLNDCFEWHPQEKVKFIVIRKSTGEVVKTRYVSEEAFFVFHHVNAYEEDDKLVVDVVAYPRPSIIEKLYLNKVRMNQYSSEDPPQLKRFVLPLISDRDLQNAHDGEELASLPSSSASAVKARGGQSGAYVSLKGAAIGEPGFDMPVVNKKHTGQHYRYVYGTGGYDQGYFKNADLSAVHDRPPPAGSQTSHISVNRWSLRRQESKLLGDWTFGVQQVNIDKARAILLSKVHLLSWQSLSAAADNHMYYDLELSVAQWMSLEARSVKGMQACLIGIN